MKNYKRYGVVLGAGLLSAGFALNVIQPASAQTYRESPQNRYEDRDDRDRDDRDRGDRDRDRDDRYDRDDRGRDDRDRNDRDRDDRDDRDRNGRRDFRTVEGVVTADRQGNAFTLRTNGRQQLRVQVRGGEPARLSRGDLVRVYGFSNGNIFHAQNVRILRNNTPDRREDRRDDRRDGDNDYRTFSGTVLRVKSDKNFDIRVGGDTFNVYTDSLLPRNLNSGDGVRVYGVRVGGNDIRNANVVVTNNRR